MILCSCNQLEKTYGGNTIFKEISFEIKEGDRIGLVGRNGSGKTTLFRLLSGEDTPDSGQIHWRKGIKVGYLAQIPEAAPDQTARDVLLTAFSELLLMKQEMESLAANMNQNHSEKEMERLLQAYGQLQDSFTIKGGYEIEAKLQMVVQGLSITALMEKRFTSLSGGEKTKIGLALILLQAPDLLILDEPTNHLDLQAIEWLSSYLNNYSATCMLVSHDRYFLDDVAEKIYDLEDGELTIYTTNFSGYVKEKEERLLREFQAYQEQQKKIKKMKEAIKRLRDWANRANPPNEGLHKRARNMERALERMEKLNRPVIERRKMQFEMEVTDRSGKDVILLEDVTKRFGNQLLYAHCTIHVTYRQRVAIIGENGTGKSTLVHMMLQQEVPDEGKVRLGSNVKIGYLAQHVFTGETEQTVLQAFREKANVSEGEARSILARFLFYGPMVFQLVSQLSGGERMRLRLAQLMQEDTNLLVLDEPTNHLDIESREILEDVLDTYEGTIIAISHDRYFLDKLFDHIYWIANKKVRKFSGNYSYAKKKMAEIERNNEQPQLKEQAKKKARNDWKTPVNEAHKLEQEINSIEAQLEKLEAAMENEQRVELLQQMHLEKTELEQKWEKLVGRFD
ncbi:MULTISPECIES: ribosomal protection-like ABC-F family protein [unclassified Virgibacillus]|uniref:ribosomal protection-like ABC-F family protein n=1 Tax=unclassified Virgibacillus TaxID=2620237 RepID=UPI0024DEA562|nr:ABC-F type ribosomal protection protein [Virgibacillus sp. LDC-1]